MELSRAFLLTLLDSYIKEQKKVKVGSAGYGNATWEIKRAEEMRSTVLSWGNQAALELRNKGGTWLGTVREWMQRKFSNGERVTWGSRDILEGKIMTVSDYEELAQQIAAAAIRDVIR